MGVLTLTPSQTTTPTHRRQELTIQRQGLQTLPRDGVEPTNCLAHKASHLLLGA